MLPDLGPAWLAPSQRPAAERAPVVKQSRGREDGSMSAADYLAWAETVNCIDYNYPDERFVNVERRPEPQDGHPLQQAMACCLSDRMVHMIHCGEQVQHVAQPPLDPNRPLQPGETIYDRADEPLAGSCQPDIVIHGLGHLPQRCHIQRQHSGANVALQERIRIQDTDDYPTIARHLARQTPIHWAYQEGYASPTLVPYEGSHFR